MARQMSGPMRAAVLVAVFALGVGAYAVVENKFGGGSDGDVIEAVQRTRELSLVSLGIQGIDSKKDDGKIGPIPIPGRSRILFVKYSFDAKLGLDASDVKIAETGDKQFRISVPEFEFIGYDNPNFEVAGEAGGVLKWTTARIDGTEVIKKILTEKKQQEYVDKYEDLLRDQTEVFYESLIASIDPAVQLSFDFQ